MRAPARFESLDDFLAVPRLTGLVLSPDGSRLVASVQTLSADSKRYVTHLWQVDPGGGCPRRLTESELGESDPVFVPDGDLLFVSKHRQKELEDPEENATKESTGLWRLAKKAGEAELITSRQGGIGPVYVAQRAGTVVVMGSTMPGPAEKDAATRASRDSAGVSAILHEGLPVRHWDRDLGPDHDRLFLLEGLDQAADCHLRDLTPDAGAALEETSAVLSADGSTIFSNWRMGHHGGRESSRLVAIDVATGDRRVIAAADGSAQAQHDYSNPTVAPDGSWVSFVDTRVESPTLAPAATLMIVDLATGKQRDLLPGFGLWPSSPVAAADASSVYFVADEAGHSPLWRVDVGTGEVVRMTRSGAYSQVCPSPDGLYVYALRSHIDSPPRPVRLRATDADQDPVALDAPGEVGPLPGRLDEVEALSPDGSKIRGWLALPVSAGRAPLLLCVHGGPLMSWKSWSWRRNPWLMVARGWAVLLPDPGLSQGYGEHFIQRAWGNWGAVPFADLMAITDAVVRRDDIDDSRTAAIGGSYGGYMVNWIAGHTDRFKAIVTHASLWTLDRFATTTDHPGSWALEWGYPDENPERYANNSAHLHSRAITTPMLVTHGAKDYRVPIGEGISLFADLVRNEVQAKLLYFPDEGHFILKPGNLKVFYETVNAFLDHHVRGCDWIRPEFL